MRKQIVILSILCLWASQPALSQNQDQLVGKVIDDTGSPLPGVSLRLSFIGSTVSDDNGEFLFNLPHDVKPGSPVEFSLDHEKLVIYQPPGGIWNVPRNPVEQGVKIVLLPKGDHRLLGKKGLKILINRMIETKTLKETESLKKHVHGLEQTIQELGDPLQMEAKRLGFATNELLVAIERITKKLQQSKDPYEAGLAALYDKHYGKAAKLIKQSIEGEEKLIGKLPEKYINLANAYVGESKFEAALEAYEKSLELFPLHSFVHAETYLVMYKLQKELGLVEEASKSLMKSMDAIGFALMVRDTGDVVFWQIHIIYEKKRYEDAKKVEKVVSKYGFKTSLREGEGLNHTQIILGTVNDERMSLGMVKTAKKILDELSRIDKFELIILPREGQFVWDLKNEFWLDIRLAAE